LLIALDKFGTLCARTSIGNQKAICLLPVVSKYK